jgi:WD40 repeat protein
VNFYFATVDVCCELTIWEAPAGRIVKTLQLPGVPTGMRIFPDGQYVFFTTQLGGLCVVDLQGTRKSLVDGNWTCMDLSPTGQFVLLGNASGEVQLWQLRSKVNKNRRKVTTVSHSGGITVVRFEMMSESFLTGGMDELIYRWDFNGKELQCCEGHKSQITGLVVGPNPEIMISCAGQGDGTAKLWRLGTGAEVFSTPRLEIGAAAVAFHNDTAMLYIASWDGFIKQYSLRTLERIKQFVATNGPIPCMWVDPTGKYLITAAASGAIFLWDITKGEIIKPMATRGAVVALDVFPSGSNAKLVP